MLNKELEQSLNKAFHDANEKRHEFITVEHLLLMLTDNDAATAVIEACGGNVQLLKTELEIFVDQNTPLLMADEDRDTQPTLGFQRVLQRALFHVQSSGNGEVSGANVLVAIFSEQDSHAVYLLNKHNIERLDITNYLSHGITRVNEETDEESFTHDAETLPGDQEGSNPLEKFATNLNELAYSGKIDPLIGRHELFLSIGGSFGHGGDYDIAVDEGVFPDRFWEVELMDLGGIVGQGMSAAEKHRQQIVDLLRDNPEGLTKAKIREAINLNSTRTRDAMESLLENGTIFEYESFHAVNKQPTTKYRLGGQTSQ